MSNTRKRFFTGIIFLLIGEILAVLTSFDYFGFIPGVEGIIAGALNMAARGIAATVTLAGLVLMYPCSKYIRIAMFIKLGIALTELASIALSVLNPILFMFLPSAIFIAEIFALYNTIDGIASYFDRLGDRERFYLGGRIKGFVSFFITIACVVSWLDLIPIDAFQTDGASTVIAIVTSFFETCAHIVFVFYLIKSCKRSY